MDFERQIIYGPVRCGPGANRYTKARSFGYLTVSINKGKSVDMTSPTTVTLETRSTGGEPQPVALPKVCGFTISASGLEFERQKKLIHEVKLHGKPQAGIHGGKEFWNSLILRTLDPRSLPPAVRALPAQKFEYYYRQHPEIEWQWANSAASEIVQQALTPYLNVYRKLTRVKIFLQIPGRRIPPHVDLVAGNSYFVGGPYSLLPARTRCQHLGSEWHHQLDPAPPTNTHAEQGHYALKIPLSEREGDYGLQGLVYARPWLYSSAGNIYFLNEVLSHGAAPVDFLRGVVFVDGLLANDEVNRLTTSPLMAREGAF